MELLTPELLQPLGVSAILAVFLFMAWRRLEQKDKEAGDAKRQKQKHARK